MIDKCINCGMCRKSCEVYNILLDEKFGARGRAILAKREIIDKTFYYCTLCGRCNLDCPLGIDLKEEFKLKVNFLILQQRLQLMCLK